MKLGLTIAGVKFIYETPDDLIQKMKTELKKAEENEKKLLEELSKIKKIKVMVGKAIKQYTVLPVTSQPAVEPSITK